MNRRSFLLAALGGAACQPRATRDATSARVVSLSPNTTEAVFALGAGPSLVGRSRYCDHPDEVKRLPQVGGYTDPNLEAILAMRPTLVTGARGPAGPSLVQQLEARQIATYFPPTESLAEIEAMMLGLGQRLRREGEARQRVEQMRERKGRIAASLTGKSIPRALLLFGLTPIVAAGPGSFADEMLRLAGGQNVLQGTAAYPTLSIEQVIALDPEVILDAAVMEPRDAEGLGGAWGSVRAAREGRVRPLRDEAVLRPGPRVLDGVASLARALRPGVEVP